MSTAVQSRRDMFRAAAGLAAATALPLAAAPMAPYPKADPWAKLSRDVAKWDDNAPAVVERARRAGLDPKDFSGAYIGRPNSAFPGGGIHLQFGEWWRPGAFWVSVSADGLTAWEGHVATPLQRARKAGTP
jgi:hypothetical protein